MKIIDYYFLTVIWLRLSNCSLLHFLFSCLLLNAWIGNSTNKVHWPIITNSFPAIRPGAIPESRAKKYLHPMRLISSLLISNSYTFNFLKDLFKKSSFFQSQRYKGMIQNAQLNSFRMWNSCGQAFFFSKILILR